MKNRFFVIDVETTGNKIGTDKIIQIGAILIENGEIIEQFASFVNPNMKLSSFIKQFTGIEDEMLSKAPTFDLIAPMLSEMLEDSYFVAHNVPFDIAFLKAEFRKCGAKWRNCPTLDTVELSRLLFPTLNSYKLNQLATELSIEHDQPHRADSDAEATAQLLVNLLIKLKSLPLVTLKKMQSYAASFQSSLKNLLKDIINEKKQLLLTDTEDYDIHRNIALKVQRRQSQIENERLNFDDFETKSIIPLLKKVDPKFEVRDGQIEMIETIEEAFKTRVHGLLEAGTGTGKTIGYLLPSILHAKKTGKRIVISTYTTHLQEQIMGQEIKILKKALPFSFKATILKGRHHYLCLRKFEECMETDSDDTYDTIFTKSQILVWLTETSNGDVDEINLSSGGRLFWNKVKSDSSCCSSKECPWFSRCYYRQKRNAAEVSDLIITNHALLLSDMKSDFSLIPAYSELVIDEAHHLDDVASDHLGIKLDYTSIQILLNQIGLSDGIELLHKIKLATKSMNIGLSSEIDKVEEQYIETKNMIDELFRTIRTYTLAQKQQSKNEIGRITYRFDSSSEEGPLWKSVKSYAFLAIEMLEDIKFNILSIGEKLEAPFGLITDIKSLGKALGDISNGLSKLLFEHESNNVTWVEIEPKGAQNSAFLYCQPIDISELLADRLFAKKESVILTSATLAINDSFQYIKSSLGLLDFEVITKKIASPFSYKDQVQLMLPTDVPEIKDVEQTEFTYEIASKIIEIARVTRGRMLVLFTSYDMLEKTFYNVKAAAALDGFVLIGQGISSGSRDRLTKSFKQHEQAILFGTSSFWEGIDIPGEDLSCIVIVRLPFSSPDNAIMARKSELMKQEGKNAFMDLFLPQAILRFKQGFGRLIRAKNDRGVVFVLDRRLSTKSYGKKFIHALPPIEIYEEKTDVLLKKLSDWL
ncbi:ATP-dependent DNA helicase DinG [Schinkia azotoformans]|uniref:ATP-dependent DNA helicase DinG n=1 Tax=Schinkia azotoformans TaxID=1454 RepID=UPI002E1C4696|nr:ATP-dependent DNA helicase DinG [Schinkia azotoformans]MED4352629.1 ATP-dependent DNA helicase DinG [Schinkia azotoformans]